MSGGGTVTVKNRSSRKVWVTISSQKPVLRESGNKESKEESHSGSIARSSGGSVGVEGIEISAESAMEAAYSQSKSSSSEAVRKYDWSPFIEAGEAEIGPGQQEVFKVDDETYYLTVRRTASSFWKVNVPKDTATAKELDLDDNGYWDPIGETISNGDRVFLSHPSGKLSTPIHTHGMWNVANLGRSPASHVITAVDGSQDAITHEEVVRLRVERPIDGNNKFLFHGHNDNLYYEDNASDDATKWRVLLPNFERGRQLRSGMAVELLGVRWSKYMTAETGAGLTWAKALPAHGRNTLWTLNRYEAADPLR